MKSSKLLMFVLAGLIVTETVPGAYALPRPGVRSIARRHQQSQQQQQKQMLATQKAYAEWSAKAQAEAAQKMAEHRAELARKKSQAQEERQAKSELIKQHNLEAASKSSKFPSPPKKPVVTKPADETAKADTAGAVESKETEKKPAGDATAKTSESATKGSSAK